jgi:hypothetical protein
MKRAISSLTCYGSGQTDASAATAKSPAAKPPAAAPPAGDQLAPDAAARAPEAKQTAAAVRPVGRPLSLAPDAHGPIRRRCRRLAPACLRVGNRCGSFLRRGLRGSGGIRTQRGRCPRGLSDAPGQVPQPAWRARADRAPHRSRCRGDLLPRHSRPLCVNGRGGWSMQHPQSCRRQLPRRERLRGVRATRASWRSSERKYRRFSNQELIFRRMRPAGLPTGIGYFLIGGQSAASHNGRS